MDEKLLNQIYKVYGVESRSKLRKYLLGGFNSISLKEDNRIELRRDYLGDYNLGSVIQDI